MEGLGDLFHAAALGYAISEEEILAKLELVAAEKSGCEEIGTERSMLEIRPQGCTVYDLFDTLLAEDECFPTNRIRTGKQVELLKAWLARKAELQEQIYSEN